MDKLLMANATNELQRPGDMSGKIWRRIEARLRRIEAKRRQREYSAKSAKSETPHE